MRQTLPPTPLALETRVWREHVVWAGNEFRSADGPTFWAMLDKLDDDEVLPTGLRVALADGSWWETAWLGGEYGWQHRKLERGSDALTRLRGARRPHGPDREETDEDASSVIEPIKAEIAARRQQFADPGALRESLIQLRTRFLTRARYDPSMTDQPPDEPAKVPWDEWPFARETVAWATELLDEAIAAADELARPTVHSGDLATNPMALFGARYQLEGPFQAQRRALPRAEYIAWLRATGKRFISQPEGLDAFRQSALDYIDDEMRAEGGRPPIWPEMRGHSVVPGRAGRHTR